MDSMEELASIGGYTPHFLLKFPLVCRPDIVFVLKFPLACRPDMEFSLKLPLACRPEQYVAAGGAQCRIGPVRRCHKVPDRR